MTNITLTVSKRRVLDEVAKTSAYSGAKMTDDSEAYDRIFTTEADRELLERFWSESQVAVCETLKKQLQGEAATATDYTLRLALSQAFDPALRESMEKELLSFFVTNIVAKWYTFTNKGEAAAYAAEAQSLLEGLHRKALFKRKPTRPTY